MTTNTIGRSESDLRSLALQAATLALHPAAERLATTATLLAMARGFADAADLMQQITRRKV